MPHVDFLLSNKGIKPAKDEDVLRVAHRIMQIRYGGEHHFAPREFYMDGAMLIATNKTRHRLYPPRQDTPQPKGYWRIASEDDTHKELELIVKALQLWL